MSGRLKKPEYEIGDPVWVYSRTGWIRVTVLANQRATETGLYQLSVDNPDVVAKVLGGVPVKLCLTMTEGGVHVLKRGIFEGDQWEENSDEEYSFCCEDTSDSSTDEDSSYSEDTSDESINPLENTSEEISGSDDTSGSIVSLQSFEFTSADAKKMVNQSGGCFDIGVENFVSLTSQSKSKFALNVEAEDKLGDMPGAEVTARAKAFRADTDFLTDIDPKYRRGDSVWFYWRKENTWVAATVTDTR